MVRCDMRGLISVTVAMSAATGTMADFQGAALAPHVRQGDSGERISIGIFAGVERVHDLLVAQTSRFEVCDFESGGGYGTGFIGFGHIFYLVNVYETGN